MKQVFKHGRMITALVLATLIFLSSCKKDDSLPGPGKSAKKLEKISQQDEYMSFQYNSDGTVKQVEVKEDAASGGAITTYQVAYNAQKQMSLITTSDGEKWTPGFTGGKLTSVGVKDNANQVTGSAHYTYQGDRLLSALVKAKFGPAMVDLMKFDFTYNAAGNNTKTIVSFPDLVNGGGLEEHSFVAYEYDAKENPLKDVKDFLLLMWQAPSNNNITKEVHVDENDDVEETLDYTYTYNSLNFPQSAAVKRTVPGQPVENSQLQVSYK
ncbi:MAG: hypothetical protein V4725_02030 [Bacteroidota bacterium]